MKKKWENFDRRDLVTIAKLDSHRQKLEKCFEGSDAEMMSKVCNHLLGLEQTIESTSRDLFVCYIEYEGVLSYFNTSRFTTSTQDSTVTGQKLYNYLQSSVEHTWKLLVRSRRISNRHIGRCQLKPEGAKMF